MIASGDTIPLRRCCGLWQAPRNYFRAVPCVVGEDRNQEEDLENDSFLIRNDRVRKFDQSPRGQRDNGQ